MRAYSKKGEMKMKKITNATLKKIETGTMIFDTISKEWVKVTRVSKPFFEIGLLLETAESLKRNYRI